MYSTPKVHKCKEIHKMVSILKVRTKISRPKTPKQRFVLYREPAQINSSSLNYICKRWLEIFKGFLQDPRTLADCFVHVI